MYSVRGTRAGFVKSSWKHSEFSNLFIQSETSASTHKYSESNRASKYVMLLSNFRDKHRGPSPVSEVGFCHQMVLVLPTVLEFLVVLALSNPGVSRGDRLKFLKGRYQFQEIVL